MNTLELAKRKRNLLKEIGDTSPYYSEKVIDDEDHRVYNFETNSTPPTYYEVELSELEPHQFKVYKIGSGVTLAINFGVTDDQGIKSTKKLTNKGELYKVMATVADIVKKDLKEHPYINALEFTPSKRQDKDTEESNARANLYKKYIEMNFKGADISKDNSNDTILVKLNSLKEVGDAKNQQPYTDIERTQMGNNTRWDWETPEGVIYAATAVKGPHKEGGIYYNVLFGIRKSKDKYYDVSQNVTSKDTQTGNLFRVMKTMIDLINKEIEIDQKEGKKVKEIIMEPSKSPSTSGKNDMRRANIYTAFIEKNMPKGSQVKTDSGGYKIVIELP